MATRSAKPNQEHILIVCDERGTREMRLDASYYSLGRSKSCDILLYSQFVSRHHATLLRTKNDTGESGYQIVDGNIEGKTSANGILINGIKVHAYQLQPGDKVVFGSQVYCIYQQRHYDSFPSIPPNDPYDITLIDPAMIVNDGD